MTTLTIQTDQSREAVRETLNRHANEALAVKLRTPFFSPLLSEDMIAHRNGLISEIIEGAADKPNLSVIDLTGGTRCLRTASTDAVSSHIAKHLHQGQLNQKRLFVSLHTPKPNSADIPPKDCHHALFKALRHSQLHSLEGIELGQGSAKPLAQALPHLTHLRTVQAGYYRLRQSDFKALKEGIKHNYSLTSFSDTCSEHSHHTSIQTQSRTSNHFHTEIQPYLERNAGFIAQFPDGLAVQKGGRLVGELLASKGNTDPHFKATETQALAGAETVTLRIAQFLTPREAMLMRVNRATANAYNGTQAHQSAHATTGQHTPSTLARLRALYHPTEASTAGQKRNHDQINAAD